jgi:TfoX/Sxy family transcriptional regulator of competence genes
MPYDEGLAERIRDALRDVRGVAEKKMFGGLCFMLDGHMMVGIVKDDLMARIGEAAEVSALKKPGAKPMDFTGKPLKGYVYVEPEGIAEDAQLDEWIAMAKKFVEALPAKPIKTSQRTGL